MALLFWDASALAKRYSTEVGTPAVNALFAFNVPHDMATSLWGYIETYAILCRRFNGGSINYSTFSTALTALQAEVMNNVSFDLTSIDDTFILSSTSLIHKHALNSNDAVILTSLLGYVRSPMAKTCVLIASDKRLVRAASAEGITTFNPELSSTQAAVTFLASLPQT